MAIPASPADAQADLSNLIGLLGPALAQAQTDLEDLQQSADVNAPLLARTIQGTLYIAQAILDLAVIAGAVPQGG